MTEADRRIITWGALGVSTVLVLGVRVLMKLDVLLISSVGPKVVASMTRLSDQLTSSSPDLVDELLNW